MHKHTAVNLGPFNTVALGALDTLLSILTGKINTGDVNKISVSNGNKP